MLPIATIKLGTKVMTQTIAIINKVIQYMQEAWRNMLYGIEKIEKNLNFSAKPTTNVINSLRFTRKT